MKETTLNNKNVLLEALEYIDRDLIAETVEELKAPPMRQAPERDKSVTRKSIKYTLLLAACLVLVSAIIPVVNYVLTHFDILPGWNPGEDTTTETTEATAETTEITEVPGGYDYVLTEEDLETINLAWNNTYPGQLKNYRRFPTIDDAMARKTYNIYYFGKYGDTFVIWEDGWWHKKCCFNINGYDFDFYIGVAWFIKDDHWYDNTDLPEELMTEEEAKAFFNAYTEHFVPLVRKEYKILNFIEALESVTLDEMKEINDAYEKWNFERIYNEYMNSSENKDENDAYEYAYRKLGYDPHRFFNEEKFEEYHYYGKVGGKAVIATENRNVTTLVTTTDILGYKFVLRGAKKSVLIYSNGVITELSVAFEKKLITETELAAIYERYLAYFYYFEGGRKNEPIPDELIIVDNTRPSPIELTLEEKREIVWEYLDSIKETEYSYGVRCFGNFDGAYAVMIDGPFMYSSEMRSEEVAGYVFTFTNGQKLRIYHEGIFYSLLEAYERGIITKENVAAIEWDKTPQ